MYKNDWIPIFRNGRIPVLYQRNRRNNRENGIGSNIPHQINLRIAYFADSLLDGDIRDIKHISTKGYVSIDKRDLLQAKGAQRVKQRL